MEVRRAGPRGPELHDAYVYLLKLFGTVNTMSNEDERQSAAYFDVLCLSALHEGGMIKETLAAAAEKKGGVLMRRACTHTHPRRC